MVSALGRSARCVFLTRSFSDQKLLEALLRREATESHVAPVTVVDPQIAG
jgi:hypothetical protein